MPSAITCEVVSSHSAGIREDEFHLMVQLFANHSLAKVLTDHNLAEDLSEDARSVLKKYEKQGGGVIAAAWVASALLKAGFSYILEPVVRLNLGNLNERMLGPYDLAVVIKGKYLVLEIKLFKKKKKNHVKKQRMKFYEEIIKTYEEVIDYIKLAKKCGVYIGLLIIDISGASINLMTPDYIAVVRATGGWGDEKKVVEEVMELARRLGLPA